MEIIYEKIIVSHNYSFITRKLQFASNSTKIHSHSNFELNYIESGSGKRIIGNNITAYTKGDQVLLGPHIPHCWDNFATEQNSISERIVTHFNENIISSDFFNIPELEQIVVLMKSAGNGIWFK